MHHGALFGGQFGQGIRQLVTIGGGIRVVGWREYLRHLLAQLVVIFFAGAAPPHQVNRRVMCQAEEKRAWVAGGAEQVRLPGEPGENFLEHVARVGLVTGEIQEEREQRRGVFVVEPLQFGLGGHQLLRGRTNRFVLSIPI